MNKKNSSGKYKNYKQLKDKKILFLFINFQHFYFIFGEDKKPACLMMKELMMMTCISGEPVDKILSTASP